MHRKVQRFMINYRLFCLASVCPGANKCELRSATTLHPPTVGTLDAFLREMYFIDRKYDNKGLIKCCLD